LNYLSLVFFALCAVCIAALLVPGKVTPTRIFKEIYALQLVSFLMLSVMNTSPIRAVFSNPIPESGFSFWWLPSVFVASSGITVYFFSALTFVRVLKTGSDEIINGSKKSVFMRSKHHERMGARKVVGVDRRPKYK